ncbi:MAG: hypothetical protein OWU84_05735 [Firmicutes bacterium]|nr:hypothetical protein [Bacillota bacterium]
MTKGVAILLGTIAAVIVGVDVAGLAGVFGYPPYDAAATHIPKSTSPSAPPSKTPTTSSQTGKASTSAPPSAAPTHTVTGSPAAMTTAASPPPTNQAIPPAVPVPPGAIPTKPIGNGSDVTAIGDSVMVDAEPYLVQLLPGIVVDGKVSRQLIQTPPVIQQLKAEGELHRYVVLELGTNGPYTAQQLRSLMQECGPNHGFVLVNTSDPLPWEQAVNQVIDEVAATTPHTVLVNWYQAAQKIPQDFYPDHVHLMPVGAKYYATLIAKAVLKLEAEYPPPAG